MLCLTVLMMKKINFILIFLVYLTSSPVNSYDRFFIPPITQQEHFFSHQHQQSSQAVFHHRDRPISGEVPFPSAASGEGFSPTGFGHNPYLPVLAPGFGFGFGGGWYHPFFAGIGSKPLDFNVPSILKPSVTGWQTNYNVPCGSYQLYPFVTAKLRMSPSSIPSVFGYPTERRYKRSMPAQLHPEFPEPRSYLPYFPSKSCSWNFLAADCKLIFKCEWFQLPALFRCEENVLEMTDAENEKYTFCGSRQPRQNKIYDSDTGKMKLTFRSQQPSLPAVFDCTVTCIGERDFGYSSFSPGHTSPPPTLVITKAPVGTTVPAGGNVTSAGSVLTISTSVHTTSTVANVTEGSNQTTATTPKPPTLRYGNCKCGVRDARFSSRGRIVGGIRTLPGEYPWTAALVRKNSQRPFCSGSLISSLYVATAVHCILSHKIRQGRLSDGIPTKDLFDVLLNEHDISDPSEIPGGPIRVRVSEIIVHPKYDNSTYNYDIALLRLETPIEFNEIEDFETERRVPPLFDIQLGDYATFGGGRRRAILQEIEARVRPPRPVPICLSTRSGKSLVDKSATVTGWGLTREGGIPSEEMLQATVKIFNESSCREFYREHQYLVTENMICASYLDGRIDSCVGDSGGGLSILDKERYTLAGIVSWGRGCGRENLPGVYTRIAGLTEWIQSKSLDAVWCN